MKAIEFEIGAEIEDENGTIGTVIGNSFKDDDEAVAVEWEDHTLEKVHVSEISLYKDMEKEFGEVAAIINRKIGEVVHALKEVNRLRREANLPSLIYTSWSCEEDHPYLEQKLEMIDVSELEGELSDAGWSTSSSYC